MALNKKIASAMLFGLSSAMAGSAFADIDITVNSAMGAVGAAVDVAYDYAALDTDDVGGFQFDLLFDPAALTADLTNCLENSPASHQSASCTEVGGAGSGRIRIFVADIIAPVEEIMPLSIPGYGRIAFTINQSGTHDVTFNMVNPGAPAGSNIAGGTVAIAGTSGTVTGAIAGAAGYGSTPAPGSTLSFGPVEVGTATAAQNITVSETGDMQLDVTAFNFATGTEFATTAAPFMIADGGADVDVPVTCTPTARGMSMDTLMVVNNSINETPSADYTLECVGTSPNVMVAPLTVSLAGAIGGTDPTATFDVTNPDDGFTSDAMNAMLAESGTAEINIDTGLTDAIIAVDETDTVTVSCSTAAAGMFTETISLTFDDPAAVGGTTTIDVTVNCDIANAFPVYESVPAPGSTLDFMGVMNGATSAPLGIDVGNSGAVGGADLNVTAAMLTGADAAQFNLTFAAFTVGAGIGPDGTDDITVTCAPTTAAALTATLVVNTDDPAEPAGGFMYPLACVGTADAQFSSTPPPGPVSFGVVPPGTNVDTIITMNNDAGALDDLTIDCSLDAGGSPEITLVSPTFPQTVVPGASVDVTLNCASTSPGNFAANLTCSTNDAANTTVTYALSCMGQALVIPTLSQWGLLAMALLMLFGGAIAFRLRRQ